MTFTGLWVIWLALFGAIEGAAILNKRPGDTLSEHAWQWFAIFEKPKGWLARRGALLVFLVWLLLHLMGWIT